MNTKTYVDPVLTDISVKYKNGDFVADQLFPIVKVSKQGGIYFKYDKSNFRAEDSSRAMGAASKEVSFSFTQDNFYATDHAFKDTVPDELVDQAENALDPLIDATEMLTEKLKLGREVSAQKITAGITLNSTVVTKWTNSAADPIADIKAGILAVFSASRIKVNTIVLPREVYNAVVDNPKVLERTKYTQGTNVTAEILARIFEVDKVLVADAGVNTAKEGQAENIVSVWGKDVVLAFVTPKPTTKCVTYGLTFEYKSRVAEKWVTEGNDARATSVRVGDDYYEQKVVCGDAAYLLKAAI